MITFGERILLARRKKKLTQQQLADAVNAICNSHISRISISRYEDDERLPSIVVGLRIAKVLGISYEELECLSYKEAESQDWHYCRIENHD